jgi:site-specific recombinase XerD
MSDQKQLDAFESGITVEEAVEEYLDHRENDCNLKETTVDLEERQLAYLLEYCEERGIHTFSELLSYDPDKYRSWRRFDAPSEVDELAHSTITTHMKTVTRFVSYTRGER